MVIDQNSQEPAPVINFHLVSPGQGSVPGSVYRSGQPSGEAEWAYLEKLGIKTVIKLNEYSTEENAAEDLNLARKHNIRVIPIYMQPEDFPRNLNLWAHPDEHSLIAAVEALENKGNLPALVHCSHGKDRTGLVIALYSIRNKNYCKDTAIKEMKYYGANPLLFGMIPIRLLKNPKKCNNFPAI